MTKTKKCIDCGKKLSINPNAIRCQSCSNKNRWKNTKYREKTRNSIKQNWSTRKKPKKYCMDCDKELFDRRATRCDYCNKIFRNKNKKHAYCSDCGNEVYPNQGGFCKSCAKKGKRNNQWIDGRAKLPYSFDFTKELKQQIRKRDNYLCQKCNITEEEHLMVYGKVLSVHHIDYNKQNCKEDNLITLCNECNIRVNFNREYWRGFFENKISKILEETKNAK